MFSPKAWIAAASIDGFCTASEAAEIGEVATGKRAARLLQGAAGRKAAKVGCHEPEALYHALDEIGWFWVIPGDEDDATGRLILPVLAIARLLWRVFEMS